MIQIERFAKHIRECTSYAELDGVLYNILDANMVEHVAPELKSKINELEVTGNCEDFCKTMLWAVCYSHYSDTMFTLLKLFANKAATQIKTEIPASDLTPTLLMVSFICADDRSFFSTLPTELQDTLTANLYYHGLEATYPSQDSIQYTLRNIIGLVAADFAKSTTITPDTLSQGNYSRYIVNFENVDGKTIDEDTYSNYMEFAQMIISIYSGVNSKELLEKICKSLWTDCFYEDISYFADQISKDPRSHNLGYDGARYLLHNLIRMLLHTSQELAECGVREDNPVIYYPVGKFIVALSRVINYYTEEPHPYFDEAFMAEVMNAALNIVMKWCPNSFSSKPIQRVIWQYSESGKFRNGWVEGDYLKACKLYLDKDPCFEIFYDENRNSADCKSILTDQQKRAYAAIVASYIDAVSDGSTESGSDPVPVSIKGTPATEASKKSEQWRYDDDEEEEPPQKKDAEPDEDEEQPRDYDIEATQSKKGYDKRSKMQSDTQNKIYRAYKNYKNNEEKVDSQLNKMLQSAKRTFTGDKTEEILSGQKWTPIKLLKKVLRTAAIFSFSKVAGFIYLVVGHTLDKRRTDRQRREIILELNTEIQLIDEKIEDARGDGNRQAKYALMRTKAELERARDRIRYNLNATREDMQSAKDIITGRRSRRQIRNDREEY